MNDYVLLVVLLQFIINIVFISMWKDQQRFNKSQMFINGHFIKLVDILKEEVEKLKK